MNERAAFLVFMLLTATLIIGAFPSMTLIVILYVAWRGYEVLNPDKINHETAVILRKATLMMTVFSIVFALVLLVIMSQSPIPPYIEIVTPSSAWIQPEYPSFDPFSALTYIITGRRTIYYSGSVPPQDSPPIIQPESTPDPLG